MEAPLSAAWSPSWTTNLIKFIILSVLFIVALVLLFTMGNLNEIRKFVRIFKRMGAVCVKKASAVRAEHFYGLLACHGTHCKRLFHAF
jgi:hypothetical protein